MQANAQPEKLRGKVLFWRGKVLAKAAVAAWSPRKFYSLQNENGSFILQE